MNLLPKSKEDFRNKSYWEDFFNKRKTSFEWYAEYEDLSQIIEKHCSCTDEILMSGCGNSLLSEAMHDVGFSNIVNVDLSETVIEQMVKKNKEKRPSMKWLVRDMTVTGFTDGKFSCVIDKGTLDAIFTDDTPENVEIVHKMFSEIHRILRIGGCYVCISLAQSHIINELAAYFSGKWSINMYNVTISKKNENETQGIGSQLQVFAFVFTKEAGNVSDSMNFYPSSDLTIFSKLESSEELVKNVNSMQEYAFLKNKLDRCHLDEIVNVELWTDQSLKEPRYTIYLVDNLPEHKAPNGKYAIFIVPQGRETEWVFSSDDGRRELAEQTGFQRLAIATMHRGHDYTDIEQVKADLSSKVMELAPAGLSKKTQVPFLTAGADLGYRRVLWEGSTAALGDLIVQDVQTADSTYRRQFIYRDNDSRVGAEARLVNSHKKSSKKKKVKERIVDHSYLIGDVDQAFLVGLLFLGEVETLQKEILNILVIGLGGGCFSSFLSKTFSQFMITCVEANQEIVRVAEDWFDFQSSEKMKVVTNNELRYLEDDVCRDSSQCFDMIVLDVVSSSESEERSTSLNSLLAEDMLKKLHTILTTNGLLAINCTQLDSSQMKILHKSLTGSFGSCYRTELGQQNTVMFCSSKLNAEPASLTLLGARAQAIHKYICMLPAHAGKLNRENLNVIQIAKELVEIKVS